MKTLIVILASVMAFASTSYSAEINMVCMTDELIDMADMDIKIESKADGKEKVSVILTGMDGDTVRIFLNSKIENSAVTNGLQVGKVAVAVSKSDVNEDFDPGHAESGIVTLTKVADDYDVSFVTQGQTVSGLCSPR